MVIVLGIGKCSEKTNGLQKGDEKLQVEEDVDKSMLLIRPFFELMSVFF